MQTDFSFGGQIQTLRGKADECELEVFYQGKLLKKCVFSLDEKYTRFQVRLMENDFVYESLYWTLEHPRLLDVVIRLYSSGVQCDEAETRFGMRKISVNESGVICLNNRPLYQKLILDQGYWPESGLTPPSAESLKRDILLAKKMGFNGARKHQKFEDPYFYYFAEELVFLVWCEMPSAYNYTSDEIQALSSQWLDILNVSRNFTSVICHVPLNESWGVRKILTDKEQKNFAYMLYYLTKTLAPGRLVSTNDGWENVAATDIISVHDYAKDASAFHYKYNKDDLSNLYPATTKLFAEGCRYDGQPVLLTEFGGIALADTRADVWGYNECAQNDEEFLERFSTLIRGIYATELFQGFCYTQLTDVMQEVNGLLSFEHVPKFDVSRIKEIIESKKGSS